MRELQCRMQTEGVGFYGLGLHGIHGLVARMENYSAKGWRTQ